MASSSTGVVQAQRIIYGRDLDKTFAVSCYPGHGCMPRLMLSLTGKLAFLGLIAVYWLIKAASPHLLVPFRPNFAQHRLLPARPSRPSSCPGV
jgi:hypothetical protein